MTYILETEPEPSSAKRFLGLLLLSIALILSISTFINQTITLNTSYNKLALKSISEPVYADSVPQILKPEQPQKPVEAPKPVEAIITPPPVQAPPPEPPKPVVKPKPKSYPMPEDQAKAFIYQKESGNNPAAVNKSSGACGLGQSLPCSKMASVCPNWQTDYECQDRWFTGYMQSRYGSWSKAVSFWKCTGQCGSIYKKATWW